MAWPKGVPRNKATGKAAALAVAEEDAPVTYEESDATLQVIDAAFNRPIRVSPNKSVSVVVLSNPEYGRTFTMSWAEGLLRISYRDGAGHQWLTLVPASNIAYMRTA